MFLCIANIAYANCKKCDCITESLQNEIEWMNTRLEKSSNDYTEGYRDAYLNILHLYNLPIH
jgi:hypothetical protein